MFPRQSPVAPQPRRGAFRAGLANAFSYIFVGAWMLWFYVRAQVVAPAASVTLIVLLFVELVSPLSHQGTIFEILPPWGRSVFLGLQALAAIVLVWHHRKLDALIRRQEVLIKSLEALLGAESTRLFGDHSPSDAAALLDALVFVARKNLSEQTRLHASLLHRRDYADKYTVVFQDSQYAFPSGMQIDASRSAAAFVAQDEPGVILYIPSTRYRHGVRISRPTAMEQTDGIRRSLVDLQAVPNVFELLDADNQQVVRSLLCVQVPSDTPEASGESFVLCLSADRSRRMGSIEFTAIQTAAALASFVLRDLGIGEIP